MQTSTPSGHAYLRTDHYPENAVAKAWRNDKKGSSHHDQEVLGKEGRKEGIGSWKVTP